MTKIATGDAEFSPVYAAHSIEQIVFGVRFTGALDEAKFQEVRASAETLSDELPGQVELQGVVLNVGAGLQSAPSMLPVNGFSRRVVNRAGVVIKELQINRNAINYRATEYTRWASVWGDAKRYISQFASFYGGGDLKLEAIGLAVFDKYIWGGAGGEASPRRLLQSDSPYIARCALDSTDLWHSHNGAFERVNDHIKRLLNVNLDCLDEKRDGADKRVISIAKIVTDMFNQPGYASTIVGADSIVELVDQRMCAAHDLEKTVLASIITPVMAKRIALI